MARENYKREVLSDEELDMVSGGHWLQISFDAVMLKKLGFDIPVEGKEAENAGEYAWLCLKNLGITAVYSISENNKYYDSKGNLLGPDMWSNLQKDRNYYLK